MENYNEILRREMKKKTYILTAIGVLEIIFGLMAMSLPFITGVFFILLLGSFVLMTGILEIIAGIEKSSFGRGFLGAAGIIVGFLIIAHPIFNLQFLALLIGIYFIASGIFRIIFAVREHGISPRLILAGGLIALLLGILILTRVTTVSLFLVGVLIGLNFLFDGIFNLSVSAAGRRQIIP